MTAAIATFALNAAECVRRLLFVIFKVPLSALSPPQAPSVPLIRLSEFARPPLNLDAGQLAAFLRGVQSVRSTGIAHRKGTEYEKLIAKLNIDDENYQAEFDLILTKFAALFDLLLQAISLEPQPAPSDK
ncbi:hypothetical protein [Paraburkholderia caballeronis]|uniref:hypothetical protein n=1 Tax=Paraburkholderia caballeronis TaxID=416943 RepID=UPI0014170CDB|nr:hypothetical protein [Paraburkholderia caballeronis]